MIASSIDAPDYALRAELTSAIVRSGYGSKPSLLATLVAAGFADRVLGAVDSGGFLEIVAWTEQTCQRYAAHQQVISMLRVACSIAQPILRAHAAQRPATVDLGTLEHAVARAIERHAKLSAPSPEVAVDDIDAAIAAFISRLDDADPLSAEHCRAVSLWCRRIARRLALDDDECTFAARSGLLHDVGKTMTPKEILSAPRGLTEEEWKIMREHTLLGAAMVREVPILRPFASAARSHHERLDGNGYPDKLAASEISLNVRIVTVADSFNAMIGHRPYRLPISPSGALEQLVTHRGTQFDPMVVEAMIDVVERAD